MLAGLVEESISTSQFEQGKPNDRREKTKRLADRFHPRTSGQAQLTAIFLMVPRVEVRKIKMV